MNTNTTLFPLVITLVTLTAAVALQNDYNKNNHASLLITDLIKIAELRDADYVSSTDIDSTASEQASVIQDIMSCDHLFEKAGIKAKKSCWQPCKKRDGSYTKGASPCCCCPPHFFKINAKELNIYGAPNCAGSSGITFNLDFEVIDGPSSSRPISTTFEQSYVDGNIKTAQFVKYTVNLDTDVMDVIRVNLSMSGDEGTNHWTVTFRDTEEGFQIE